MRKIIDDNFVEEKMNRKDIEEIELELIHPFRDHPFKVLDDEKMDDLVDSIIQNGILSPVICRHDGDKAFEMISGHRRLHAAQRAKLKKIPAIVMDLSDDEAVIIMVDSNTQREEILPSERAFSLKMKMDAMRHQGACRHDEDKLSVKERKSAAIVGKGCGLAASSVHRYIRLTALIPELLDLVDKKEISLVSGVEISAFDKEIQRYLFEYIKKKGGINSSEIAIMKKQTNIENLTPYTVMTLMKNANKERRVSKRVSFTEKKLNQFFPEDYPASKREKIIIELLTKWKEEQGEN